MKVQSHTLNRLTRCVAALALFVAFGLAQIARAEPAPPPPGPGGGGAGGGAAAYSWPRWGGGVALGPRALGHFGRSDSLNIPPGGFLITVEYHHWYEHLVEMHASFGLAPTNGTTSYGVGMRVNLFEFVYDASGQLAARGLQRGLLVKVLRNFMIFGSMDYLHYGFPDPLPNNSVTYDTQVWVWQAGLGVQWYVNAPTSFARRWYLETSAGLSQIGGGKFIAPFLGIGLELK